MRSRPLGAEGNGGINTMGNVIFMREPLYDNNNLRLLMNLNNPSDDVLRTNYRPNSNFEEIQNLERLNRYLQGDAGITNTNTMYRFLEQISQMNSDIANLNIAIENRIRNQNREREPQGSGLTDDNINTIQCKKFKDIDAD